MTEAPNVVSARLQAGGLSDVLAGVLRRVHLNGAVFLRGEFTAPWAFFSNTPALKPIFAPGSARLVLMHLAVEGCFRITLANGDTVVAQSGDAVVLPYSDAHSMGYPDGASPAAIESLLPPPPWDQMPVVRHGGGGPSTRILCGYLHGDDLLFHPLLSALPRLIHVRPTCDQAAHWREASVRYLLDEATHQRLGAEEVLARLPELVFVDCLRQYIEELPSSKTGLLAAFHDLVVAHTLELIHAEPTAPWTVSTLARHVAVSRSVLAERFTRAVGVSPMRYLAQWRLRMASELLRNTPLGMTEVAARVGYESDAAFSRAFKRHFGRAPAVWRRRHTEEGSHSL
jgi:AraC family transcriptional regulator, alkane utilization regulator